MRSIENQIHGNICTKCGKFLLYGAKVYMDGDKIYCYKCGKEIK